MKLKVLNSQGGETGREVELPEAIFAVSANDHAIYLDVKQYLAQQRQGTSKTKDKSEIKASTRKIKKQKGSGTARAGSVKSGIMRGGGRFHGPRPRDYSFKLNRKVKQLARKSALSYKASDKNIFVIESISMDKPNTQSYVDVLSKLNIGTDRSLLLTEDNATNVYLSARNLQRAEVCEAANVNTYSILKAKKLILTEAGIEKLVSTLSK